MSKKQILVDMNHTEGSLPAVHHSSNSRFLRQLQCVLLHWGKLCHRNVEAIAFGNLDHCKYSICFGLLGDTLFH